MSKKTYYLNKLIFLPEQNFLNIRTKVVYHLSEILEIAE